MSVGGAIVRTRAVIGLALAQLRRSPGRTVLTVLAVGHPGRPLGDRSREPRRGRRREGRAGTGQRRSGHLDLSPPVDPGASGTENPISGAHGTAAELTARDDIASASPIAMYDVYLGTDPSNLQRRPAVGVQETHDGFDFEAGQGSRWTGRPPRVPARRAPARRDNPRSTGRRRTGRLGR